MRDAELRIASAAASGRTRARWDGGTDGNAVGNDSGSSKSRNTHSQRRPYVWQGEVGLVAVPLEKQLAPAVLGANFSFGLGIGVAILIERKTDGPLNIAAELGAAFPRVQRIDVDFRGWQIV